jgi:FlaA1/EpsC-like NDP-sugar epimerase
MWPDITIRVFSRDELKQSEMRERMGDDNLRFVLGDVRDRNRLVRAAKGVDFIVHAAAMKQVPACEYNPFEAVQTNVIGAQNVVDAAIDAGVPRVVALSTDKAVNPVNLYGATKLCAEKLFVQGNAYGYGRGTIFSVVRYGNVIGSRGSVIPLFAAQRATGTVTVTDPGMTRFWLRLEEGVGFAVRCTELMRGGEIFVPKIPSMRILDLVESVAPGCPASQCARRVAADISGYRGRFLPAVSARFNDPGDAGRRLPPLRRLVHAGGGLRRDSRGRPVPAGIGRRRRQRRGRWPHRRQRAPCCGRRVPPDPGRLEKDRQLTE